MQPPNKPHSAKYRLYMMSFEWQVRRSYKLQRAGYQCERCQCPWGLQVHHLSYERLGRERDEDLEVLCRDCHLKEHGNYAA